MPRSVDMTTVQVPRSLVAMLPRHQVHRRQQFYEVLQEVLSLLAARGDESP